MFKPVETRRLIVFVDDPMNVADSKQRNPNNISNISRLKGLVTDGVCQESEKRAVTQIISYHEATEDELGLLEKFKSRDKFDDQIEAITRKICQILESPQDELFLYGAGKGAYIVRAVAGAMHHMGLPKRESMVRFHELYLNALDLYKARCEDNGRKGLKIVDFLKAHTDECPRIRFVGLFDTVRSSADRDIYDLSFVNSIHNMRHALALNEDRASLSQDNNAAPASNNLVDRSFISAYFIGIHDDIAGGAQHDGLSLYPVQWMVLESMKFGLILSPPEEPKGSPLALIFPQFAGELPKLGGTEQIEWQLEFTNGIKVSMFDLQASHVSGQSNDGSTMTVRLQDRKSFYRTSRKVFNQNELIGWFETEPTGTIIHPSVFCLLDRYPRLQESPRFKSLKRPIADFEDQHLKTTSDLPPWLENAELQASGVKAFRILVCGKTGVGKSTLINKVFGVEMTEEAKSYQQGVHDINVAFESPSHPGLLVHDSRGWQAGSDQELELIAKFLRHRAFQKNPADALHVIWFCVDSDVSRIEEADRKTFETIARYSNEVPVFVVGTKKDKLVAFRKIQLLEQYMEKTGDYQEAKRLAGIEADKLAFAQFEELRNQLSEIKHYKADGYCFLSKDDEAGIKNLLSQTIELIADDRVRLFCVAAQVVDVDQKINSAITECMRLGTHAIRTAIAPLPLSGIIGTPTVSRILCEHILQCFGFPRAAPEAVEEIMSRVVMKHLKSYMAVALTQAFIMGNAMAGLIVGTMGAGVLLGLGSSIIAAPPTARMVFQCACDMILILERAFRYDGRYVSVRQIEDAAKYYTGTKVQTFGGKEKLLQMHVHDEVNRLIPLTKIQIGYKFASFRTGLEDIIYNNRFDKKSPGSTTSKSPEPSIDTRIMELEGKLPMAELDANKALVELEGSLKSKTLSSPDSEKPPYSLHDVKSRSVTSPTETVTSGSRGSRGSRGHAMTWSTSSAADQASITTTDYSDTGSVAELEAEPVSAGGLAQRGKGENRWSVTRFSNRFSLKKTKSAN